jgi:predicted esterase
MGRTSPRAFSFRADPIAPAEQAERLADVLRQAGADVTLHWTPGGHGITKGEVDAAREWISQCLTAHCDRTESPRAGTD